MWICTPFGLLMPSLRPVHTVPAGDDRLIQVRTRRRVDLTRFRDLYLPELGEIIEIPNSDYEYRAYCTHEQLAAAVAKIAMDIDFVKFKPTTDRFQDHQLHSAYNAMWGVVFRTFSTPAHQRNYWKSEQRPAVIRFDSTTRRIARAEDESETGVVDWTDVEIPAEWDSEVPTVTRRPDGKIDHSYCDHTPSKAARRRCRERNSNG